MSGPDDLGGGVDRDLLRLVARRDILAIPPRDADDPAAMLLIVSELIERAHETRGAAEMSGCVFVLSEYPDEDRDAFPEMDDIRQLRRKREPDIFGRLHIAGVGADRCLSMKADCRNIKAVTALLERHAIDHRPAAAFDASSRSLLWFPDGVRNPVSMRQLPLSWNTTIGTDEMDAALDAFHNSQTREHRTGAKYWSQAAQRVPCRNTEKAIQEDLRLALEVRFYGIGRVDREPVLKGSTVDFAIYAERRAGEFEAASVLEVKVFREYHFPEKGGRPKKCPQGTNADALESGIEQAVVAQRAIGAPLAYVASYDMRASDDNVIMDMHKALAAGYGTTCRRYFMEIDSRAFRKAVLARPRRTTTKRSGPADSKR